MHMQHTRRLARPYSLAVLAFVPWTGHVQAVQVGTITRDAPPAGSQGIYTPAQVVAALMRHRHAWVGRTVRVALPMETMDWGRGSSYGSSAYQISVQLPALPRGVNESGDPFDVLVSDQQMKAARHAARAWHSRSHQICRRALVTARRARVAQPRPHRADDGADGAPARPRYADRRSAPHRRRDGRRVPTSIGARRGAVPDGRVSDRRVSGPDVRDGSVQPLPCRGGGGAKG